MCFFCYEDNMFQVDKKNPEKQVTTTLTNGDLLSSFQPMHNVNKQTHMHTISESPTYDDWKPLKFK